MIIAPVLPWLEYRWSFDFPVGMYGAIVERLRGTSARLEERLRELPPAAASLKPASGWSIVEHAGHLISVERLWQVRLEEYLRGATALTAADMSNRATEEAGYGDRPLPEVVARFREVRAATVATLEPLDLKTAAHVAHHPRLDRPMRLVDLCFFAAEHDDHHLAMIATLLPTESSPDRPPVGS